MKHIFIINPNSGRKRKRSKLINLLTKECQDAGISWEIYYTDRIRAAEDFVRKTASGGEKLRFYACGGDGTLSEVANGAFGFPNVEVAAIPSGTGNDFCRNFSDSDAFQDIGRLIRGSIMEVDVIRYNDRCAVNAVNIGFDCAIVNLVDKLRKLPFMGGPSSYTICSFLMLLKFPKTTHTIYYPDGRTEKRCVLLNVIANGSYCGGGFCSTPMSNMCDGQFELLIADGVIKRMGFLRMVGSYKDGSLPDKPWLDRGTVTVEQLTRLRITNDKPFNICVDGDISTVKEVDFELVPKGLRFVVPEGVTVGNSQTTKY